MSEQTEDMAPGNGGVDVDIQQFPASLSFDPQLEMLVELGAGERAILPRGPLEALCADVLVRLGYALRCEYRGRDAIRITAAGAKRLEALKRAPKKPCRRMRLVMERLGDAGFRTKKSGSANRLRR